jgi:hypothetical protein
MNQAGYSQTPLIKKLGIKDSQQILLINEPSNYFDLIEKDISKLLCSKNDKPDFIHLFVSTQKDFERDMEKILKIINDKTIIWVSWYKKSSGIITDVTEDVIRNYALQNNLVDVKVCAVTEVWSGLKLVVPVSKRK